MDAGSKENILKVNIDFSKKSKFTSYYFTNFVSASIGIYVLLKRL